MATTKPPALRKASTELGELGTLASGQFATRNPELLGATTGNLQALLASITGGRKSEISSNRKLLKGSKALKKANQTVQAATAQYTAPTVLEPKLASAASAALDNPASPLLGTLTTQAQAELGRDGALSPEEEMIAEQGARRAFTANGLAGSNPAAMAEVLGRVNYVNARKDRARAFAGGVEQLGQSSTDAARRFALGVNQQELEGNQFRLGALTNAANFRMTTDPTLMAYSTPSMVPGALASALQVTGQADVYPQVLQYGSDVNNTNFNALESRYNAEQNRIAALKGAGINAAAAGQAGQDGMMSAGIGAAGAVLGAGVIIF